MAELQKHKNESLSIAGNPGTIGVPTFTYDNDKWSTTRTLNTEDMAARWKKNPNLVLILSDAKFGADELAIVRNDKLQQMQKMVRDILSGEAQVRHTTEALLEAVHLMEAVVEEQKLAQKSQTLAQTLKVVGHLRAQAHSMIVLRKEKAPIESSPLTDDEKKLLEEVGTE